MNRTCLCLSLCIAFHGIAFGQETLNFVYTSYVPANYYSSEGDHRGFFVDIIREALENRMRIPVSMSVYPWPRCQYMVKEGLADMIATVPTAERREYAVVIKTPIWIKQYKVFTVPGHPAIAKMGAIRSVDDLKRSGLTVVSYLGNDWNKSTLEKAGIKTINAASVEGMYLMLLAGRADVVIEDPVLAEATLSSLRLSAKVLQTPGVVEESAFHLMLGKASPYSYLADDLDRVLAGMWADGTVAAIMRRYQ